MSRNHSIGADNRISETERTKVFERFHRIARVGNPDGSGLGLAVVRTLADQIGAVVTLENRSSHQGLSARATFAPLPVVF